MKKSDIKTYLVNDIMYVNGEVVSTCYESMTAQDLVDMLIFRKQEGYITQLGLTTESVIIIDSYRVDRTDVIVN